MSIVRRWRRLVWFSPAYHQMAAPGVAYVAPWNSPPTFLLMATALATLPYPAAALTFLAASAALYATADGLAEIDLAASLALLALERDWCRPVVEESLAFEVEAGRHPVVEMALREAGQSFIANDCNLSGASGGAMWLLTGPNMGGKSTFLRQNALIAILAQAGSFVPAKSARLGLVDRVFSRVGASDVRRAARRSRSCKLSSELSAPRTP